MLLQESKGYTLGDLALRFDVDYQGDPECRVTGVGTLQNASASQISFLANPKYKPYLATTSAAIVILTSNDAEACSTNRLITANPYLTYAKVASLFADSPRGDGQIHASAVVDPSANVAEGVSVGANAVIEAGAILADNVTIGAGAYIGKEVAIGRDTVIKPNVTLYAGVQIGQRCTIHSGAVVGADGFGFANEHGKWVKVPQLGVVRIGNDVDIGALTSIDCGAIEDTIIEDGVILDNHCVIGHNVRIGAGTAMAGRAGVAGSTKIGKHCNIGGGASINGHIELSDFVMVTGTTGIGKSIKQPGVYSSFLTHAPHNVWKRTLARLHNLSSIVERIKRLEKKVGTSDD